MRIETHVDLRDRVIVDKDPSIIAVVIGIMVTEINVQAHVAWTHCGDHKTAWVDDWRLTQWEG